MKKNKMYITETSSGSVSADGKTASVTVKLEIDGAQVDALLCSSPKITQKMLSHFLVATGQQLALTAKTLGSGESATKMYPPPVLIPSSWGTGYLEHASGRHDLGISFKFGAADIQMALALADGRKLAAAILELVDGASPRSAPPTRKH